MEVAKKLTIAGLSTALVIASASLYIIHTGFAIKPDATAAASLRPWTVAQSPEVNTSALQYPPLNNIFLVTIPKSASEHIVLLLTKTLNYKPPSSYARYHFPNDEFDLPKMHALFYRDQRIVKSHLLPTENNVEVYRRFTDRLVLHLRDPRQVLLSWVYHLDSDKQADRPLPPNYYLWDFNQKLNWHIDQTMPKIIAWITGWLEIKQREDKKPGGLNIFVTTYDDLLINERDLLVKILVFNGISTRALDNYTHLPPESSPHFRKANPNEWKSACTAEQKHRLSDIVPPDLLRRFNWQVYESEK